jgi:hypothetical protein
VQRCIGAGNDINGFQYGSSYEIEQALVARASRMMFSVRVL